MVTVGQVDFSPLATEGSKGDWFLISELIRELQ